MLRWIFKLTGFCLRCRNTGEVPEYCGPFYGSWPAKCGVCDED